MGFIDDNLLKANGSIRHHGENVTNDEELTPTLENVIVITWLRLVHPDLPALIKQRYGTELLGFRVNPADLRVNPARFKANPAEFKG